MNLIELTQVISSDFVLQNLGPWAVVNGTASRSTTYLNGRNRHHGKVGITPISYL